MFHVDNTAMNIQASTPVLRLNNTTLGLFQMISDGHVLHFGCVASADIHKQPKTRKESDRYSGK
jgi:hypothetical protein